MGGENQEQQEEMKRQQEEMKNSVLSQVLDQQARARCKNVRELQESNFQYVCQ